MASGKFQMMIGWVQPDKRVLEGSLWNSRLAPVLRKLLLAGDIMEGGACLLYTNYDLEEIRSKGAIGLGGSLPTSNSIVLLQLTSTTDQASA